MCGAGGVGVYARVFMFAFVSVCVRVCMGVGVWARECVRVLGWVYVCVWMGEWVYVRTYVSRPT